MGEAELAEIESRIDEYPPQARHDIVRLMQELRQFHRTRNLAAAAHGGSPLYDPLTGLLNGAAYGVRFGMARARATRFRKIFAVMSIGVDLPREAAERERAIRHVADRLEDCVRETDTLARIGDGDFAIILEDLAQPGHAERVREIVQGALADALPVGTGTAPPPARVSLTFYPGASDTAGHDASLAAPQ
jgi:GGDEF domain-containing protein